MAINNHKLGLMHVPSHQDPAKTFVLVAQFCCFNFCGAVAVHVCDLENNDEMYF